MLLHALSKLPMNHLLGGNSCKITHDWLHVYFTTKNILKRRIRCFVQTYRTMTACATIHKVLWCKKRNSKEKRTNHTIIQYFNIKHNL